MNMSNPYVSTVFEGTSDQEMVKKNNQPLRSTHPASPTEEQARGNVDKLVPKLAKTGAWNPWIVFRDSDTACPVKLYKKLTSSTPPNPASFFV